MKDLQIRALRPDEIECRVNTVNAKGFQMLLYKDARCDMNILDETFGIMGWERGHDVISNNLFCAIRIWDDENKQWVTKQDVGTESNTEKEKGEASDSFKRACVNIGIGRELYTKIFIWVAGGTKQKVDKDKNPILANGKPVYVLEDAFAKYHVSVMEVDKSRNKITKLMIENSKNEKVFSWIE